MLNMLRNAMAVLCFVCMSANAAAPDFVPGQLIVKLKSGADPDALNHSFRPFGASRMSKLIMPGMQEELSRVAERKGVGRSERFKIAAKRLEDVYVITLPPQANIEKIAQAASRLPGVEYAKPNRVFASFDVIPSDPMFPEQYALYNVGQTGGGVDADIDATVAWHMTTGSSEVVVGILDVGVASYHEDLADNIWTKDVAQAPESGGGAGFCYTGSDGVSRCTEGDVNGWNFCNHSPVQDDNSFAHGTHIAGIIGAKGDNGVGISGVSWNARLMSVQVLCPGFGLLLTNEIDVAAAMLYSIAHGANIINASWGGLASRFHQDSVQLLFDAFTAASDAGVMLTVAAGNFPAQNNDDIPVYPANFRIPGMITVAATDDADNLAYFSSYGPTTVDIAAPGQEILSTITDYGRIGNAYGTMSGTSMAAPMVAGGAALVMAIRPDLEHEEVKDVLLGSADRLPALAGKVISEGRMNVGAAVSSAYNLPLSIGGQVVTRSGRSVSDVSVSVANQSGTTWSATTDDNGRYRTGFSLAHNRPYYVQLDSRIYNTDSAGRLLFLQDKPGLGIDLVALPAISGHVRDANGVGLGGAQVKVANCCGGVWTMTTAADGSFISPRTLALNTAYYVNISDGRYSSFPYGYFVMLGQDEPVMGRDFVVAAR